MAGKSVGRRREPAPVEVRDRRMDELRRFAWLMDNQFRIPGTNIRFGFDALVGLVPGLGDFAGAAASAVFLVQAARMGAPAPVLGRMALNVALETIIGSVPALGDLFDVAFKANQRNFRLMERLHLDPADADRTSRRSLVVLAAVLGGVLLLIGILAVIIGVLIVRAITGGQGPLG